MHGLRQFSVGVAVLALSSLILMVGYYFHSDVEQQPDFAKPSATSTTGDASPKTILWSNCPERP